jgi:hypothetical protein
MCRWDGAGKKAELVARLETAIRLLEQASASKAAAAAETGVCVCQVHMTGSKQKCI